MVRLTDFCCFPGPICSHFLLFRFQFHFYSYPLTKLPLPGYAPLEFVTPINEFVLTVQHAAAAGDLESNKLISGDGSEDIPEWVCVFSDAEPFNGQLFTVLLFFWDSWRRMRSRNVTSSRSSSKPPSRRGVWSNSSLSMPCVDLWDWCLTCLKRSEISTSQTSSEFGFLVLELSFPSIKQSSDQLLNTVWNDIQSINQSINRWTSTVRNREEMGIFSGVFSGNALFLRDQCFVAGKVLRKYRNYGFLPENDCLVISPANIWDLDVAKYGKNRLPPSHNHLNFFTVRNAFLLDTRRILTYWALCLPTTNGPRSIRPLLSKVEKNFQLPAYGRCIVSIHTFLVQLFRFGLWNCLVGNGNQDKTARGEMPDHRIRRDGHFEGVQSKVPLTGTSASSSWEIPVKRFSFRRFVGKLKDLLRTKFAEDVAASESPVNHIVNIRFQTLPEMVQFLPLGLTYAVVLLYLCFSVRKWESPWEESLFFFAGKFLVGRENVGRRQAGHGEVEDRTGHQRRDHYHRLTGHVCRTLLLLWTVHDVEWRVRACVANNTVFHISRAKNVKNAAFSSREIFPYLVVMIGLENVIVLTKSVVSTPIQLDVKFRIAQGTNWTILIL